ncbi:MAG: hypothetical protein ACLP2P_08635 [Desulfobaccales bacterium]
MLKWSAGITMVGLALGGLLLAGTPAAAEGPYDPNFNQREGYQQQRIQQGIESGALTQGEARNLEKEQGRIERAEDRMKADGHLSPWERQRLNQMQNRASQDIYRLEHNNRTAEGWGGNNPQGWSGHTNSGWRDHDYDGRGRRDYGERGHDYDGRDRRGYAWQGNNPGGHGNPPGGPGYPQGWQGNGNQGWRGNNPGGNTTVANGNTAPGNTQGWHGNRAGGNGTPANGVTTSGTTQGQPGNYNRNGQSGAFRQPGTTGPQGQPQYQQARTQTPQPTIRPNAGMMPRQPAGIGRMANGAGYAAPRAASRRR